MANQGEQGTGKHAHKKVSEPYEHHGKGGETGGQQASSEPAKGSQSSSKDEGSKGGRSAQHGEEQGQGGSSSKGGSQAKGKGQEQAGGSESDAELKSREYTDAEGNVHHHTKAYMEQHKGE